MEASIVYFCFDWLALQVKLERMQMFYVSNVIGVLFPIASFALSAWSLHPADIEGRLAVDFQLILTAVAFKLVLNSMTPNVRCEGELN